MATRIKVYGPLGMSQPQWQAVQQQVSVAARGSVGRNDSEFGVYLRGSAASGVRKIHEPSISQVISGFLRGREGVLDQFRGPRDFDMAVVSPTLLQRALRGTDGRGRGTRTEPYNAQKMEQLGFPGLPSQANGRPISYVIFSTNAAMNARAGPAIPIPTSNGTSTRR
jgi:hypothetical protein